MRKLYLLISACFAFSAIMAQTIENFESLKMNLMAAGENGMLTVVPNPDTSEINPSVNVVKFVRGQGDPWAGFYATLPNYLNLSENKYVHVKVWKPRISPVKFKFEGTTTLELESMSPQTKVNEWEELVFDFSELSDNYNKIVFMPDFEDPLTLTDTISLYFDDLYINNDPSPGSDAVQLIEDFETIQLNYMAGGEDDEGGFTLVENPDKSGANLSDYVVRFARDMDGVPWGGFWSPLSDSIDVSRNKFVHVKVWKTRISPVKFKLEGGTAGNSEIFSMNPQTKVNEWEDMVFDFSEKTGKYQIIAFMPDFEDPLTLTADDTIYFDDIILNNSSVPFTDPMKVINVDMHGSGLSAGQQVFISGTFGGKYGTWDEPGSNPNNELTATEKDSIYSITMNIPDGVYTFKFFKGTGWGGGDEGPGDRLITLTGDTTLNFKWGESGIVMDMDDYNLIKDGHFDTDGPVSSPWEFWSGNGGTAEVSNGVLVMTPLTASDSWQLQVNQTGNTNGWELVNDSTYVLMFDAWSSSDRVFNIDFEDNADNDYNRFGISSDSDAVNGESEWAIRLSNQRTTYTRVVTFTEIQNNTTFKLNIMPGAAVDPVYIDDIYLFKVGDLRYFGLPVSSINITSENDVTTIEEAGGTLQLNAEVLPENAIVKNISWSVLNETGEASISPSGELTAVSNGNVTVIAKSMDWWGVSDSLTVTISGQATGISGGLVKNIKIYPNPVQNELNISLPSAGARVSIYNSLGAKTDEILAKETLVKFDVSRYSHGVYYIRVDNKIAGKFIK